MLTKKQLKIFNNRIKLNNDLAVIHKKCEDPIHETKTAIRIELEKLLVALLDAEVRK